MLKRLRLSDLLRWLEVGLAGMLFISGLRFLIGALYSRTASASLVTALPADPVANNLRDAVDPAIVSNEISLLGIVIALPLLTILVGRVRYLFVIVALAIGIGRMFMVLPDAPFSPLVSAQLTVAGGILYLALLIRNRAPLVPGFFVIGLAADQLTRAIGDTLDITWSANQFGLVAGLAGALVVLSLVNLLTGRMRTGDPESDLDASRGIITIWGAIGLGALLYLQLALLATPNAIAGRTQSDYTLLVPATMVATLLPLIPWVRRQARQLIAPFDSGTRGWVWLIGIALLIVIGTRIAQLPIPGLGLLPIGAVVLVVAQVGVSLLWWWIVRPQALRERHLTGLWLSLGILVFALFVGADLFTYEYAFVRPLAPPLEDLNPFILPLLRGFRGLGLGVLLLGTLLAVLPVIQSPRRLPWRGSTPMANLAALLFVVVMGVSSGWAARPPVVEALINPSEIRVGTYNIHGGYSEFYDFNMSAIAATISRSGADVILLQEVEKGRLTSFGVDQSLWLARQLRMDTRFFATNEGLQGLAVLSRMPIIFDDGTLLPSIDQQTGLQRVQIQDQPNTAITLYNTSLGLLLQGEDIEEQESNQQAQIRAIVNTLVQHIQEDYDGQLGRVILGGTFHNVPDSPTLQLWETLTRIGNQPLFVDPFAGANLELSATIRRTSLDLARWDYLWLSTQGLRSTGTGVIAESDASDHRLAFVGVQIRRTERDN